eukprot:8368510-Pyramimonas_sp.AAC.1
MPPRGSRAPCMPRGRLGVGRGACGAHRGSGLAALGPLGGLCELLGVCPVQLFGALWTHSWELLGASWGPVGDSLEGLCGLLLG